MDVPAPNESLDNVVLEGSDGAAPKGNGSNATPKEKTISKLDQDWRKIVRNFTPS